MSSTHAQMTTRGISIVLGTYNRRTFLKATIDSVRAELETAGRLHEIIVIDGGSTDGTVGWLAKQKDVVSIIQHNRGTWKGKPIQRRSWGYFMNLGFKCAQGKYVCMLSDDCLLVPGAVKSGIGHFETLLAEGRNIGAVAFYWRNWPDMKDYWVGLTLGGKMFVNHGIFLRKALEAVDWVDEERYQFYHADGDLCLRLWHAGYEVVDCPEAFVEHFSEANLSIRHGNLDGQKADWQAYVNRWTGVFFDPLKLDGGGWIYRSYEDRQRTVRRFPRRGVTAMHVRHGLTGFGKRFVPPNLAARLRRG